MTPEELAAKLNGRDVRLVMPHAEKALAKASGLVVVFGVSNDFVVLRGAIEGEVEAIPDSDVRMEVDAKGLLPDFEYLVMECSSREAFRDYFQREGRGWPIDAVWDETGRPEWTFQTDIPHATFDVLDNGTPFCRGIVFRLADVATPPEKA